MFASEVLHALSEPAAWWLNGDVEGNAAWHAMELPTSAVEVSGFVVPDHPAPRQLDTRWGTMEVAAVGGGWMLRLVRPDDSRSLRKGSEYQALFRVATDGIFLYDDAMRLVDVNPTACRLHGWSREQMLQMHPSEFIHHSTHHVFADFIDRLWSGKPFHGYARGNRADGTTFDIEATGVPILLRGRRHYVGSIRDITDRLRLQEELAQARRLDSMSRMAGSIAHDFNNLLTVILSSVSIGVEEAPTDAMAELMREARDAALRARSLTDQLLTFAQGRVTHGAPTELRAAVAELMPRMTSALPEGVTVEVHAPEDVGHVSLPPDDLEEVLQQLLSNAVQAMPEGTVSLQIVRREQPARQAGIIVTDTGVGMTPEQAAQAFEPYYTTRGEAGAYGLGLATVHGIVQQHGGVVKLESRVGEGSTVQIWWPVVERSEPNPPTQRRAPVGTSARLLVVEDEPAVRRVLERMLSRAHYEVAAVATVEEAAAHLADRPTDMLLTDLRLGDGTGIELTATARSRVPQLPVLWISGQAPEPTERPDDVVFLEKPFSQAELLAAVQRTLGPLSERAS